MPEPKPKSATWKNVKAKLADFDRPGLIALIRDLYDANHDNQIFLYTRFGLGQDVLKPYRKTIQRWLAPNVMRNDQEISVTQAKQAISEFKKAVGDPDGLAELLVFYCEVGASFCADFGNDDIAYYSMLSQFQHALKIAQTLSSERRQDIVARLKSVQRVSLNLGYGVGDAMDEILLEFAQS
jgi:hypothetical protein